MQRAFFRLCPGVLRRASRSSLTLLIATLLLWPSARAAAAKVTATAGQIEIPTYGWAAVKHPYFRGTDNVNIYPYRMLDFLSREKTNRVYRTVILENDYLRITFLPELGGKIHEVIDKTTGEPMFYVNHVIKPGLIGQCGAWTSGGVEWNTGPQGHTVGCMLPVDVRILAPEPDGARSVAIGETERIYGTKWTVVVTLRPGRSFIEERIRIYNPTETVRPYYFWNCTAVPNTPGFRFIYPMTLGCDHAGEKFFQWPIDHGKDLTCGTNYIDASSIFAWHCDQDFFGSYNDDLQRGIVAFANHHQVPGKKAWTWGQGGFGKMHQMDLTDTDGPYNEVQTGPLLTQAQVGRLDASEAVEWNEWWYPVRQLGGFTFANREVAVNASREAAQLRLRMLATAEYASVEVRLVGTAREPQAAGKCQLSPRKPTTLTLALPASGPATVELVSGGRALAQFDVPLSLPERKAPEPKPKAEGATELLEAAWQDYLFARYEEARDKFKKVLEQDSKSAAARTGLALLDLTASPETALRHAMAALETSPDSGPAHLALAAAAQQDDQPAALDHAWKASLDPATAVAGRALGARILLRRHDWDGVVAALSGTGPWQSDPVCRDRLAFAQLMLGRKKIALELARTSLATDPLDSFAMTVLWAAGDRDGARQLADVLTRQPRTVSEAVATLFDIAQPALALRVLEEFYLEKVPPHAQEPLLHYWAAFLNRQVSPEKSGSHRAGPAAAGPEMLLPHRVQDCLMLKQVLTDNPQDGCAAALLAAVTLHLGREKESRDYWARAASLDASSTIPKRALGMLAKSRDKDLAAARKWLEQAASADPADPIVARDVARVLFELADNAEAGEKQNLITSASARLQAAFDQGKGRSDYVALLARAHNRLGQFASTAALLDRVRVTVWEGAREVHDLFEQAHLALGEEFLKSGEPVKALAEFNRALEYPENLATGKLENAREAHIHYLRGNALQTLGRAADAAAAWKLAAEERGSGNKKQDEARQRAREALERLGR